MQNSELTWQYNQNNTPLYIGVWHERVVGGSVFNSQEEKVVFVWKATSSWHLRAFSAPLSFISFHMFLVFVAIPAIYTDALLISLYHISFSFLLHILHFPCRSILAFDFLVHVVAWPFSNWSTCQIWCCTGNTSAHLHLQNACIIFCTACKIFENFH